MKKYSHPAIALHWLIAVLIVAAFALGLTMTDIPGITPTKLKYFSWHKWIGVTVFGLVCMRLLWRLTHPAPAYPDSMPGWQKAAAHGLHGALYVLIFAIPLTGYFESLAAGIPVVYLGVIPLPVFIAPDPVLKVTLKQIHYVLNMTMLTLVVIHVLAALKHHFIDKDGVLHRMLP
jgi:cytochrome b561